MEFFKPYISSIVESDPNDCSLIGEVQCAAGYQSVQLGMLLNEISRQSFLFGAPPPCASPEGQDTRFFDGLDIIPMFQHQEGRNFQQSSKSL